MREIEGYKMPEDLYYHKEHMWIRVNDNKATVGLTDFNQKLAGEISYIELPEEEDELSKDEVVGSFETGKWLGKIYAPASGKVSRVNEELEDDPSIINSDPYGEGWLFEMELSDPTELDSLMKGDAVVKWLKGEIAKHAKK